MAAVPHMRMIGCSVLKKETRFLMKKNGWQIPASFLNARLHVDYEKLQHGIEKALAASSLPPLVIYGACHPLLDQFIEKHHGVRTDVQNCIELLLGKDAFHRALESGAFFLLEEWAHSFNPIMAKAIGKSQAMQLEILHEEHTHVLAITTPCSEDFSEAATRIAAKVQLPLKWKSVSLTNMDKILKQTVVQMESMP